MLFIVHPRLHNEARRVYDGLALGHCDCQGPLWITAWFVAGIGSTSIYTGSRRTTLLLKGSPMALYCSSSRCFPIMIQLTVHHRSFVGVRCIPSHRHVARRIINDSLILRRCVASTTRAVPLHGEAWPDQPWLIRCTTMRLTGSMMVQLGAVVVQSFSVEARALYCITRIIIEELSCRFDNSDQHWLTRRTTTRLHAQRWLHIAAIVRLDGPCQAAV